MVEGTFRFKDSDLEKDVSERLGKILAEDESLLIMPPLSSEEINKYVKEAIEDVGNQGNTALYQGLVLYTTKIALKKARESH